MIKAILFDYDGVLTTDNTGSHTTNKHISKVSGLSYDVVERAFAPFNFDLNIGRTEARQSLRKTRESPEQSNPRASLVQNGPYRETALARSEDPL